MLGLLEIDCGFCAACCTKLSCCSGLIDAWSEVIFFAGTSATDLVIVFWNLYAGKPGAKLRCSRQASVWCAQTLQGCDTKSAHTSRTRAFEYREWASPSRARYMQPACVQRRKKGRLEYSPTSSERAPGREKTSGMWGSTEVGLGELRQI